MTGNRFDGYIRVSRVNGRGGDSFISPDVQRKKIEQWAVLRNVTIEEWHTDLDQSGGKLSRPGFDKALQRVQDKDTDGIVVAKLDRFSRAGVADALRLIESILESGGQVASVEEGIDPTTPTGGFVMTVFLALAKLQRDQLTASWQTAQQRAVDRGVWIGQTPFGYWRTLSGRLEPDADSGPIVREAFKTAAAGGLHAAMRYLAAEVPRRRWRTDEVRNLLRNRVYLGESSFGDLLKVDAHEPLTLPETFAAVQAVPEMTATARRSSGNYPLTHIAHCGKCGAGLIGQLQVVGGRRYRRYRCSDRECRGGSSIGADKLEAYVKDRVGVALGARANHVRHNPSGELEEANEALAFAVANRDRWAADDTSRNLMGEKAFHDGLRARAGLVEAAEGRYRYLAGKVARSEVLPASAELDDPEQMARAVRAMVQTITIRPGRGTVPQRCSITWQEEVPTSGQGPFWSTAGEATIEAGMKALAP